VSRSANLWHPSVRLGALSTLVPTAPPQASPPVRSGRRELLPSVSLDSGATGPNCSGSGWIWVHVAVCMLHFHIQIFKELILEMFFRICLNHSKNLISCFIAPN
jgi:hypothetical protein